MTKSPETLTRIQIGEAKVLGGAEDPNDYRQEQQLGYFDKGGHKIRSVENDKRTGNSHGRHWKEVER